MEEAGLDNYKACSLVTWQPTPPPPVSFRPDICMAERGNNTHAASPLSLITLIKMTIPQNCCCF